MATESGESNIQHVAAAIPANVRFSDGVDWGSSHGDCTEQSAGEEESELHFMEMRVEM